MVRSSFLLCVLMMLVIGDAATARNNKIFGLNRVNNDTPELSDVSSLSYSLQAVASMGAGIVSEFYQGFKDKRHTGRRTIEIKPKTSPSAGINKEIQEQSDGPSSNGFPKAMSKIGEGNVSEFDQGFKDEHNTRRRVVEMKRRISPRAGINKEIQEQSDGSSSNGFPKAMGPVAMAPMTATAPVDIEN
ncbi:hypothetical protein GH714_025027 [Hevea brasiliensis]|uniref:Uncharacterized protein n=1 Tax=Hevea brasiliensis TaxID=3981 RepID=A0A6A6M9N2_HEVBR|nr:hypothetical protein GH714_025027 [Hevea brasiliensis]